MSWIIIHVGGPEPLRAAGIPRRPMATEFHKARRPGSIEHRCRAQRGDREPVAVPAAVNPIDERAPVRKTAYTLSIVLGAILIIGGVATWILVSTTLADQKITVSDDASCLAGDEVNGPFSAYCEAMVIDKHALEATGGLRYAELDREDPKRQTAQTASFLQASLFTSVVAFGVAAMAIAIGVLFILIGLGIRDVANRIRDLASRTPATA
jgi:uncharacterized membrane protein YciS (DUF1049 family)